ncbi:ABC transporter substrate-binding protein [Methyloversatilis sp.]|uniref:ABC transporter substrate-binding protein n=1 Tax=Methyloversatilis sp. TaxID=2569862 RepID=UPI0027354D29|nr:ABC transporter substrate-binding protein [Methyloversatilis sp.]MDP2869603.1 ABC transporter substrate-binding protein [Methyloversatilis sp.]MDP3289449.1 ABC transporter substrate-binding protein [Methyloversatilis sp.]MDP3456969.1 ABC transporter substrate-binding protein [Methyloversatilis sp.]MDP3579931.1 ABC transporter substrate-binding protein [Methyloversatilis sp.]
MALSACSGPPELPLRVGLNPWLGYDPLVLARERGLIDPANLRVVELESSGESARQLRNGLLEAAGLTLAEAIELASSGMDIKVVAILSLSKGADAVVAQPGFANAAALKGARIGMENSALADVMLQRLLEAGALQRDALSLSRLPVFEHENALMRGRVDAVITFEPVLSSLVSAGYRVLLDSADMPGEVVDVLVVRSEALSARPAQVRALLRAFEDGRLALLAQPQEAARTLAAGTDLDTVAYLRALGKVRLLALEDSVVLFDAGPEARVLALGQLVADLKASQRVMAEPDWTQLFDGRVAADVMATRQRP